MGNYLSQIIKDCEGPQEIDNLIALLNSDVWAKRRRAAIRLGEIGDSYSVDALINTLHDSSNYVREAAAEALGRIGDKRAIKPLIQVFNSWGDSRSNYNNVISATIMALQVIGRASVLPLFEELESRHAIQREYAVRALAGINDKRVAPRLIKVCNEDSCYDVRWTAQRELRRLSRQSEIR